MSVSPVFTRRAWPHVQITTPKAAGASTSASTVDVGASTEEECLVQKVTVDSVCQAHAAAAKERNSPTSAEAPADDGSSGGDAVGAIVGCLCAACVVGAAVMLALH